MKGAPTKYTIRLADEICEKISTSTVALKYIAKDLKISVVSIYKWLNDYPDFANNYTRAREAQADLMAEEILEIADDGTNDYMTIEKGDKLYNVENKEVTNRSRLRVDARKWVASKLKPKKYGDKLDVTTDGEKITSFDIGYKKPDSEK